MLRKLKLLPPTCSHKRIMERITKRLACDLSQLQNVIKRDPHSYLEEVWAYYELENAI